MLLIKISSWQGRLGNNIYQISNAIKYAQLHNAIFMNDLNHDLIKNFSINFTNINDNKIIISSVYVHEFFYENRNNLNLAERRDICIKYILPNLLLPISRNLQNLSNKLYLQIRGEDAFQYVNGSPYYPQPPLCFYTYIIETYKYDQLEIITKDMNNPCTQKLLDLYKNNIKLSK